ncbi:MAG TPA: PilZ domain-containing protein [Gemmataceae bacterium]|jgi:hypothetical protein|nr:PilZ domain-containing protein [Gemmataceae bacterium]
MSTRTFSPSARTRIAPPEERRQWPRHAAREIRVNLILGPAGPGWPAEPQDMSRSGIRLLLTRPLEVGTEAMAVIYHPGRHFFLRVPLRVAYVIEQAGDRFIVGASFARELTADEMRGLL